MKLSRYALLVLALIAFACLAGCSDDDDPAGPGTPEDPYVAVVVVNPESVDFAAIGEESRFDATAFDQNGAAIDTFFTWQSSNDKVVAVGQDGHAVATGLGTAEVYVFAGSGTDTAQVTVSLNSGPLHEWIATGGGNWEDADNWNNGVVPGAGDVVTITAAGDYTVTLNGDVEVEAIVLGTDSGTQTLETNANKLQFNTAGLLDGGILSVSGDLVIQGDVSWTGGTITGTGLVEILGGAELHAIGNPLELQVDVLNRGTITVGADANLRVSELLECSSSALIDLQDDASIAVQFNGDLRNAGTIRKSRGAQEAAIFASSAEFTSTGSLRIDEGSLLITGGTLRGIIEIDKDAMLRQSSSTTITNVNSQGDGPFVVTGNLIIGTLESNSVNFTNLILDSGGVSGISGPGNLLINHSFTWRRGTVADLGSLNTQVGSTTTFENTGTCAMSATTWHAAGVVAGDSNVNIILANGSIISVEYAGRWLQSTPGIISQGVGDIGIFDVIGEFHRTGEGAFVVKTAFECSGTLNLEGNISLEGSFNLFDSGIMTGGSTDIPTLANAQLTLVNASSAEMLGTVQPDLDGRPAYFGINGNVELASSFMLKLDVPVNGEIPAERLFFLRGGQELGGRLELRVMALPDLGTEYQVVDMLNGSGAFEVSFTDSNPFEEIIQDERGVLLRR